MTVYKKVYSYMKPYIKGYVLGFIFLIVTAVIDLIYPMLFKFLIDDVLIMGDNQVLNYIALAAIALFIVKGIFNFGQVYLLSGMGEKVITDLRNDLYRHMQGLSLSFYEKWQTGELISRATNDINTVQISITTGIPGMLIQPLKLAGIISILIYYNWKLSLLAFLIFPLVAIVFNKFGGRMRKISNKIQQRLGLITTILQETISGIMIVKAFNMEKKEIDKFTEASNKTLNDNLKGVQIRAALTPLIEFILAIGVAIFFWYGGRLVINGELKPGELILFLTYMAMLMSPINIMSENYNLIQKAAGSAERILEIFDIDGKVVEDKGAVELPQIEGKVEFKDVYFSYKDGEEVLNNINFIVEPGETLALVGHSGAGKSTLVKLIPRFYNLDRGEILIDDMNISKVSLKSLRRQIGIVPQDTMLFRGTIAQNIAYGVENKSREEIIEAARQANAHQFIINFKDGYETEVGERGVSLSGGQKQRISIARAILTNPRILILDEATSSLDMKSEALVQEALERLMINRTTFVIAHRLSTIIDADRIIVLEQGRVIEEGSHEVLMKKEAHYHRLYKTQFM
ncbi:MAG TPA: ABC transporter ATP-binding protein [Halanaerobiales bacterium]|nr:ABC transporter ATP-binding protein [Halanaerobiales bacterium]